MKRKIFFILFPLLLTVAVPSVSAASGVWGVVDEARADVQAVEKNFGEDFARPIARLDLRLKYQNETKKTNVFRNTYRVDYPLELPNKWQISTRADLPVVFNNATGQDNRKGDWAAGLGDILTQAGLVSPQANRFRYGAGIRVFWPSATGKHLGSGRYQLVPLGGCSYSLPGISEGTFVQLVWREPFSVGADKSRKDIHQSIINPGITIALPRDFYVTTSPDIQIDWASGGRFFLPFNLSAGKRFGNMITSLEWNQALVKKYRPYDWGIEARVGYFF